MKSIIQNRSRIVDYIGPHTNDELHEYVDLALEELKKNRLDVSNEEKSK